MLWQVILTLIQINFQVIFAGST